MSETGSIGGGRCGWPRRCQSIDLGSLVDPSIARQLPLNVTLCVLAKETKSALNGLTIAELCERSGQAASQVAHHVRYLCQDGYAERLGQSDQEGYRYRITDAGAEAAKRFDLDTKCPSQPEAT